MTVAKNPNEAVWCGLLEPVFGRSLESWGRFCVGGFGIYLDSVAVTMPPHLINFKNRFSESYYATNMIYAISTFFGIILMS